MNRLILSKEPKADFMCERALRVQIHAAPLASDANNAVYFTFENIETVPDCSGTSRYIDHIAFNYNWYHIILLVFPAKAVPSPILQFFLQS